MMAANALFVVALQPHSFRLRSRPHALYSIPKCQDMDTMGLLYKEHQHSSMRQTDWQAIQRTICQRAAWPAAAGRGTAHPPRQALCQAGVAERRGAALQVQLLQRQHRLSAGKSYAQLVPKRPSAADQVQVGEHLACPNHCHQPCSTPANGFGTASKTKASAVTCTVSIVSIRGA